MDKTDALSFALGFLFAGLLCLLFGATGAKEAVKEHGWPAARGKITSFDIDGPYSSSRGNHYRIRVRYDYRVKGVTYEGQTIGSSAPKLIGQEDERRLVKDYPVGKAVTVYYDPANPETAVLEAGFSGATIAWLTAATLFLVLGITGIKYPSLRTRLFGDAKRAGAGKAFRN